MSFIRALFQPVLDVLGFVSTATAVATTYVDQVERNLNKSIKTDNFMADQDEAYRLAAAKLAHAKRMKRLENKKS